MSTRLYHLTIEFDSDTEEIEYIVESVEQVDEDHIKLTKISRLDLQKYFDEEDIVEILDSYEVGEA